MWRLGRDGALWVLTLRVLVRDGGRKARASECTEWYGMVLRECAIVLGLVGWLVGWLVNVDVDIDVGAG